MSERAVVLQVSDDDPARVGKGTMTSRNLLEAVEGEVRVDLVVQGGAVAALARDAEGAAELAEHVAGLEGLTVLACRNALAAHDLPEDQLAAFVQVIPAGVAHCAERQWAGWAYVRV